MWTAPYHGDLTFLIKSTIFSAILRKVLSELLRIIKDFCSQLQKLVRFLEMSAEFSRVQNFISQMYS